MALSELQRHVLGCIAANRSETSYLAGGLVLNADWPRRSDDVDIFHDTDEEIAATAQVDISLLRSAGFRISVDIQTYGLTEATVRDNANSTIVQWMSETRIRFYPLVRDQEWGARLHINDLAVNKAIAASSRTKARDFVDLATIADRLCPLGPLILASVGKPPHFSPQRSIEEMRRRGLSISNDEMNSVKGLPEEWNAAAIRERLISALDRAERYILGAPIEVVGLLAARDDVPTEVSPEDHAGVVFRKPTAEPNLTPTLPAAMIDWAAKT